MIGERVQTIRKEKGLSLTELAERAGVAKSYLSALERNIQTNPSIQFLEKIANVLQVPVDAFLKKEKSAECLLDKEWLHLMEEAIQIGVPKEVMKEIVEFYRWKMTKQQN